MPEQRIIIIGGGPTGLGAAWRLTELGYGNWELHEADDRAGGLAGSVIDDQGFTWDLGGHVAFSHYQYFDRLLDDLLGDDWVHHQREAWVWIRNRFIPYPFQNNIGRLPEDDLVRSLAGLLDVYRVTHPKPASFREWILQQFGAGLAEVFLLPYNFKVWAYDPSELATQWMGERVVTVDLARIMQNIVRKKDDVSWGPNATFRFPLYGGTGAIWRASSRALPAEKLRFGSRIERVNTKEKSVTLRDGSDVRFDRLINTIPLDRLAAVSDRPDLTAIAGALKHSSTHIVGIGLNGQPTAEFRTKCWIYFSEDAYPFYRVTVFSNYSPNNVPRPGEQWSLMAEVSESPCKPVNAATLVDAVKAGLKHAGFITDEAAICSTFHRRLEYGYPTPSLERDSILTRVDPALTALGVYSRGRFGAWKYEVSNQDHSLMQGVEVVDHLLFGAEETTFRFPNVVNAGKASGRIPLKSPRRGAPS